jgi:hypothetical protein
MAAGDDNLDDLGEDQPVRIARPQAVSTTPALTLRGVSPQPAPPTAASTSGIDASTDAMQGNADKSRAMNIGPLRQTFQPPPGEARLTSEQNELSRLRDTGSGISQVSKAHPLAGGFLRGLNVLGSAASTLIPGLRPALMAIPGTEEHHNSLMRQEQGRITNDEAQQEKEAQTGEAGARTGLAQAQTGEAEARQRQLDAATAAAGQPKAKEEKWDVFTGFTDTDGTPLIREENSGQVVRANDKKPPTGFQPIKPTGFQTREITRVVNGVPHTVMVDAQTGADVKDEGQTKVPGESPADKRNAAESAQVEREARQNIRKAETQYRATQQSVNQIGASIDAAKDGNGLITSFVPTMEVLGINASNGVHRISPAEAQAAALPGGWAERFNAWFDKASTGKLSPWLQAEGKQLAKILSQSAYQRYKSTYEDENGIVSGYGGTGFGNRVPLIPGEEGGGQQTNVIFARDPQGHLHQAPAGTALPKGWTKEQRQ